MKNSISKICILFLLFVLLFALSCVLVCAIEVEDSENEENEVLFLNDSLSSTIFIIECILAGVFIIIYFCFQIRSLKSKRYEAKLEQLILEYRREQVLKRLQ